MMYVNQIIMLYTLNLHSAVCHLYFNKTEEEKKKPISWGPFFFLAAALGMWDLSFLVSYFPDPCSGRAES